jgi:hypothetical protein
VPDAEKQIARNAKNKLIKLKDTTLMAQESISWTNNITVLK